MTSTGSRPRTISELFPDKWLKAAHLYTQDGRPVTATVTIARVDVEEVHQLDNSDEEKAILTFVGKDKRLILNKTQALVLAKMFHSEFFEDWEGKTIAIAPGKARNGKLTISIFEPEPAPAPPPNVNTTTGEVLNQPAATQSTEPAAAPKPGEGQGEGSEETKIRDGLLSQHRKLAARAAEVGLPVPPVNDNTGVDELLTIVEDTTTAIDQIVAAGRNKPSAAISASLSPELIARADRLNTAAREMNMSQVKFNEYTSPADLTNRLDKLESAIAAKRQALAGQHNGTK